MLGFLSVEKALSPQRASIYKTTFQIFHLLPTKPILLPCQLHSLELNTSLAHVTMDLAMVVQVHRRLLLPHVAGDVDPSEERSFVTSLIAGYVSSLDLLEHLLKKPILLLPR